MSVQMELSRIIISEMADRQIIVLKEVDGERHFPIVIGTMEAAAIDRRLKGKSTAPPPTSGPQRVPTEVDDLALLRVGQHLVGGGDDLDTLLRPRIDPSLRLIPEIRGTRLMVSVRLMRHEADDRLHQSTDEAAFELTLCA